jgi:cell division protease FtsH
MKLLKNFILIVVIFLALAGIFSISNGDISKSKQIGLSEFVAKVRNGEVSSVILKDSSIEFTTTDNEKFITKKETNESLAELLKNYDIPSEKINDLKVDVKTESGLGGWASVLLPSLIPLIFIIGFFWLMARQVQGMNNRAMGFGQDMANGDDDKKNKKDKKPKTTFKDVAGAKEAKQELVEVVEFLSNPKKFTEVGAKIPRGVLLVGPAGTGKTLLAKAVSGEAGVPFFNVSGSEFVEMFVGVGASRVRSLFQKAKKNAPCIIFIDELDAIGRQRGGGMGGSHDEREQTLNQILVEMDGFETNAGVVILAATNRPDVLDAALLRPGRFDRRVVVDLPDLNDRIEILKVHAQNKPLNKDVDLRRVAERTPGFSGADLANLLNEAAILTAKRNKKKLSLDEVLESIEKVMLGPERRSRVLNEKEKKITAYHEAGHALLAHKLPNSDPVHKVSIISRGSAGGYTFKVPSEDKHMHTRSYFIDELSVLLAGHASEKTIFGEVTTGATSDLKRATNLARSLVTEFGMSEKLPPRTFGDREELIYLGREISEQRDYSEKTAEAIDKEVDNLIIGAYAKSCDIIKEEKEMLDKIANELLEKETLEKEEFEAIVGKKIEIRN